MRKHESQSNIPPKPPPKAPPPPPPPKIMTPYEVLQVSATASQEEIAAAYKRMAQLYHPDKVASLGPELREVAEQKMKEINIAYAALTRTTSVLPVSAQTPPPTPTDEGAEDELFPSAVEITTDMGRASTSVLQRRLSIGYGRAAKLLDLMERRGFIGPSEGASKPRKVLQAAYDYRARIGK